MVKIVLLIFLYSIKSFNEYSANSNYKIMVLFRNLHIIGSFLETIL